MLNMIWFVMRKGLVGFEVDGIWFHGALSSFIVALAV